VGWGFSREQGSYKIHFATVAKMKMAGMERAEVPITPVFLPAKEPKKISTFKLNFEMMNQDKSFE
jgi:hypothetical protein